MRLLVPTGQWQAYLRVNTDISDRSARVYIQVAKARSRLTGRASAGPLSIAAALEYLKGLEASTADGRHEVAKDRQRLARKPRKRNPPGRAELHHRMKLGDAEVDQLKDTSLGTPAELDALRYLNRGASLGTHTPVVKRLMADARAGKAVSAIAEKNRPWSCEVESKDARIAELETENQGLKIKIEGLESEIADLRESKGTDLLSPPQLVDRLERQLAREGLNADAAAPLRKIRALFERPRRPKVTINLKALPAAGEA
jgi:hypothetical protein